MTTCKLFLSKAGQLHIDFTVGDSKRKVCTGSSATKSQHKEGRWAQSPIPS